MHRLAALVLLLAATASAADLVLEQTVTTTAGPKQEVRQETEYMTPTRIVTDGANERTIIDLDRQVVTVADKQAKTWFAFDVAAMRKQAAQVEEQMAKMPPEARQMMEKMAGKPGEAHLEATGRTETIAGYPAKEYAIRAGMMEGSVWVTDALKPPFDVAKWRDYATSAMLPKGPGRGIAEAFAKIDGVPLRRTMSTGAMGPQKFTTVTEVTAVRTTAPPADVLAVPDGFREVKPPVGE